MTMLITGGTSSIGRVLIKELAWRGENLRVLVRRGSDRSGLDLPGVEFVPGDVTDPRALQAAVRGCKRLTHLAAVVGSDLPEAEWWRVNRDGTRNVLQAALDLGVESMVQVSSLSVLGPTQPDEIADETRPIDTSRYTTLYQKTKHAADEIAREYAVRGLGVKIVYPGFGFGCSWASSHASLQDQTLLRMAGGKPVAIMGSGQNRICLAYYKDTAAAILLAHDRAQPGDDFILGNENLNFVELWAAIAAVLNRQPPRLRVPLPVLQFVSRAAKAIRGQGIFPDSFFEMIGLGWSFSNHKAREKLGWLPRSVPGALAETWSDYQAQGWKP
jgi:dihydroflavonol-4-reductase